MQQRIVGLVGGMSWESSAHYYRLINEHVRDALGGMHSARLLLWSFDFAAIEALQRTADWQEATRRMIDAARRLEAAGATCIVICTNTMHRMAEDVQDAIGIPLLHIADPTAAAAQASGLKQVGLLGTAFTMEQAFYTGRLQDRHGLQVLVPGEEDRAEVHRIIYEELVQGRVLPASQAFYREVMQRLVDRGAQAVILGCTEIMMLVGPDDASVPLLDTTALHARAAAQHLLGDGTALPVR
ncbi:aspartate/glutamate racemase family protein [Stenotrophomonas sp. Sa5BUN4]|uniref:Aspartate/glutamate racemase family protein n=1 Tax=Stenotrophomonas lacuserhaii TaxID=2760084 RepID=A0A8X8K371_9GAMM|nr:aspartate/glutamate racemase family protein [Stenotrophomonas pennii]MBD7953794.1 aspartate/glutamate racemase family protein [Stenotrophomonas pennii]